MIDETTKEIIEEMKSEGLMPEEPKEEPKEQPKEEAKPEEKSEEPEEPAKEPEKEEEPEAKLPPRTPYIPYNKFKEERTKWQAKEEEYQKQIGELSEKAKAISNQPEAQRDDDISTLAEEYGVDEKLIERIVNIAEKKSQIPQDILESVNAIKEERERQMQFQAFDKEFDSLLKEFPEAKNHKPKLQELAFSETLSKTPLRFIFLGADDFRKEPKKTAEISRGGTDSGNKVVDFEKIKDNPEIIKGMSDEEFDKYSSWLAKNTKKLNITSL